MTDKTKIMFSQEELRIVNDTSWILTKDVIIKKIYLLFSKQVEAINAALATKTNELAAGIPLSIPKISRGERYQGLPYVMLDYPAAFDKENIFALRTMFWWGNFFSVSIHLSGAFKEKFAATVYSNSIANPHGLYICVNNDPWQHHFDAANYLPLEVLGEAMLQKAFFENNFLKIAVKIDPHQWGNIDRLLEIAYQQIISLFCN